ncbi:MAG: VWA domain-containing protein [Bacteroidetes bacterium]|nr:VWA domain-containing protein [Bacteroidota bacterium]
MRWITDISFAHPHWLYLLLLLPALIVWYIYRNHKLHPSLRLSDAGMMERIPKSPRVALRHLLFALRLMALAVLILALARPQSSSKGQNVTVEGIDIVISLDISGSMLARDFRPDRMEAAKELAAEFIRSRKGDRIGLVIFSGESFTQVPLTTDHNVVLNMLSGIKSGMIEDGTAIGDGLATAVARLRESNAISKVVILLTDGVNNTGSIDPVTAAELARVYGVRVYTIGIGSYGTAPYPVQTPFGIQLQDMPVEIDEPLMQEISARTDGRYFRATSNQKLREVYQEIDRLERSKIDVTEFSRKHEEFKPLLVLALILIALEFVLRNTVLRSVT